VSLIEELEWRQILKPAPLRPRHLDGPRAGERIARLRTGLSIMGLVERTRG